MTWISSLRGVFRRGGRVVVGAWLVVGCAGSGDASPEGTAKTDVDDTTATDDTDVDDTTAEVDECDWVGSDPDAYPLPQPPLRGAPTPCVDVQEANGVARCADGRVHQVTPVTTCDIGGSKTECGFSGASCDPGCGDGSWCVKKWDDGAKSCECQEIPDEASDCPSGSTLVCMGTETRCMSSDCTSDADCGGYLCEIDVLWICGAVEEFGMGCETGADRCHTDDDCSCLHRSTRCARYANEVACALDYTADAEMHCEEE